MATGLSPVKGGSAGDHLVEHDPERVDVAAGVDGLALGLLGREVGGRAHDRAGLGEALARLADGPGDAEVGHLDLAGVVDQDVAGLDVAVDHAAAVGEVQGAGHVRADGGRPGRRSRAPWRMQRGQGLPVDVLHDDEVRVLALAPVVDRHDVGVATGWPRPGPPAGTARRRPGPTTARGTAP